MKNLKKVLSLGLALVMLLGMMTVASAAGATTKLADMDKVVNKNEVSLLVDLGVISGIKDGDQMLYKPENAIQRDAWAKMVYYVMEGVADETPYKNSSTLKDIENNWANGFISYLATAKIVSGDDLGNYNPLRSIRVNEAAKTLLTAAGWDASDRDYVGASWSGSVMSDANRFGLMNGIALTANDTLTRDAAAKMIVNALDLAVVKAHKNPLYVGTGVEKFVDRYDPMNETLGHQAFGLVKVSGVVDAIDEDGNITWRNDLSTACNDTVAKGNVVIAGDASMVGQSVVVYVKAAATFTGDANGKITLDSVGTVDSVISSAPILGGMTVLKTVTGGIADWEKAATKGDDDFICEVADDATYYVNGKKDVAYTTALKGGEVAEFCDTTGDGKADTIRVYNWTVAQLTDDVKVTTKKDETKVQIPGVFVGSKDAAAVTGYEGLKKGDVVLSYTDGTNVVIEKPETLTGAVASRRNGKLTVAGKALVKSDIYGAAEDIFEAWTSDNDTAYTWYLDKNGDVCYYVAPAGAAVETKQAIVLTTEYAQGTGAGLISAGSSNQAKAQLLFTDGTTEVVNVTKVADTLLKDQEADWSQLGLLNGQLVDYSVDSSKNYTLTAVETSTVAAGEISAKIDFASGFKANANTLFIVGKTASDGKVAYTTYTGFANLPGMTTTEAGLALVDGGYAKLVYLITDKFAGDAPEGYIFVTSTAVGEVAGVDYVTTTIINAEGEEEEAKFAADVVTKVGLFTIGAVDENGVITELVDKDGDLKTLTVGEDATLAMAGGVFTVDGTDYQYDNKTLVIIIDMKDVTTYGDVTLAGAANVDLNDDDYDSAKAAVVGDAGSIVDVIVIVRVAAAE